MTREDAIKIFNTVLLFGKCDCPKEEIEECFKVAIKALEQESTTKNDLGVDCIDRQEALNCLKATELKKFDWIIDAREKINKLPSVTPQGSQAFKWCTDCKEYDQEKHCCHRWSKVIRDTVEEMKQEPILDKIRAEIEELYSYVEFDEDIKTSFNMVRLEEVQRVIDKYKAKVRTLE